MHMQIRCGPQAPGKLPKQPFQCCKVEHPIYHMVVPINLRCEMVPAPRTDGAHHSTCEKFGNVMMKGTPHQCYQNVMKSIQAF